MRDAAEHPARDTVIRVTEDEIAEEAKEDYRESGGTDELRDPAIDHRKHEQLQQLLLKLQGVGNGWSV